MSNETKDLHQKREELNRAFVELCAAYKLEHPELGDAEVFRIIKNSAEGQKAIQAYGIGANGWPKADGSLRRNPSDALVELAQDYMVKTGERSLSKAAAVVLSQPENKALAEAYARPMPVMR